MDTEYTMKDEYAPFGLSPYWWVTENWEIEDGEENPAAFAGQTWTYEEMKKHIENTAPDLNQFLEDLEEYASTLTFPRFGYTTSDEYEDGEEWYEAKAQEAREDYATELEEAIAFMARYLRKYGAEVIETPEAEAVAEVEESPAPAPVAEATRIFLNISERYGNPESVTIDDYVQLNAQASFEVVGDEIREYDADGEFVEVVARITK